MSDYPLWLRQLEDEEEDYRAGSGPIPAGHPDEFADTLAYRDELNRYADAPAPWRSPVRESDDWIEPEELAA